jgi:hypothetical protein
VASIVGPLLGGALNDHESNFGNTCKKMGFFATSYAVFYCIVALILSWCSKKENKLRYPVSNKKMDSLASFINDMTKQESKDQQRVLSQNDNSIAPSVTSNPESLRIKQN